MYPCALANAIGIASAVPYSQRYASGFSSLAGGQTGRVPVIEMLPEFRMWCLPP